jgi:hypothetical protein
MKKIMTMTALILLCAGLALAQTGTITELSGTVELKAANQPEFIPAKIGDTLSRDTVISTGFKSTALVSLGSSVITVRPLTRLSLAELSSSAGTETINVSLQTGRVRVDVNPPAGTKTNMTVRGPSATASVRGTAFDFDTRNLFVSHGVVAFSGTAGGTMLVGAGSTSVIESSGKAADPIETTAAALVPSPPAGTGSGSATDNRSEDTAGELNLDLKYE